MTFLLFKILVVALVLIIGSFFAASDVYYDVLCALCAFYVGKEVLLRL